MTAVTSTDQDDLALTRLRFKVVAIAEAVSWAALLVGMYLKRVAETTDVGVQIAGPIHGVIFIAFVVMCVIAKRAFAWDTRTFVLALVSAVPPFTTVVFERWAERRGHLAS